MDRVQIGALVLATLVAAALGLFGLRAGIGYVTCHQRIESIGLGLTAAYDPLTNVCAVRV